MKRYMTTENELLSLLKTLIEYLTILLSQLLIIHGNHKYALRKFCNMDRVSIWRLIPEDNVLDIENIQLKKVIVVDELSQLPNIGNQKTMHEFICTMETMS